MSLKKSDVEAKLRAFLTAVDMTDLAGEERRIARLLLAADLAGTTERHTLAALLREDRQWIADLAPTLEASGIWQDRRSNTAHYWREAGCSALIGDILVVVGRARRIVTEFGTVNYGPVLEAQRES